MDDSARPRVLVIRGGAIGDFILTLPAIRLLRQNLPRVQIEVMGYPGIASLAVKAGVADSVRTLGDRRLALLYARGAQIDPALAEDLRSYNMIVSYLYDPDGIVRENLEKIGVKTLIECPHNVIPGQGHAAKQLARSLEKLAMFLEEPDWRQPLLGGGAQIVPKRIALHLGSGSLTKNWPVEGWRRIAQEITEKHPDAEIVLVMGEAEMERGTVPVDLPWERWSGLPLTELAERLGTCSLFLGHDSGISHLASTCGVPCLLLFGPTDPVTWAPPQTGLRVLRAPEGEWRKLPYEAVRDTVMGMVR
ncbi:glycosyltransferase family 9 protein [Brevifollis gellanilyticus]|uniref:Glycosyl transferase n=1 Tax=Brevifollis gellanilyticus TaxID=748831 RepID=A0A512MGK9_9BACT|nr:glycosyltransferase family 9 protein [Brevifollis gellanilyticus]GEP45858.1 hypothetical protein BGE01nite_51490 [Brevifollis gellanilyticus]